MNAEKTGEKTEEDKKSEPQNESVLTSEQSKVPTDETTKLTDSKPEDSQELFEASPVKSPTAEPVPKGRGRGRGVTPGGRGRGGLKRPAAALAPLKRPAASAPTLDAPEGTEETKGSDAEDKSDVKVPTVSGDGDGDGVGSSGDLPTTKNAKVSPKVNKHDAKEEKPKKTKKGGKRVLLQTVGQWEVYEMERLKGVHVGQKLNLAKSMEAVVERAASLEEAAECEATAADPLGALLSRAMVADKVELEALLGESARRASAFEDELDNQRIRLHREPRPANQSLLTAADLMKQTSDLTEMQTKAARELTELQALQDPGAGEEWKTACDSLETKWKQFVADSGAAELQKQRQKLQKRTKAKSAAPTPLELGRLLEDEGVLQALELDRDAAMKECQQFIDTAEARHCDAEANQWKELLQGWQIVKEDMAQELSEAMPEATVWASAATKAKIGKVTVDDDEQLALLAEAARCAAAFDEELQKQRQQMKKRRKALQKGGSEQAADPLDVCRTMADEEALKRLSKQQAEAHAKCQEMATSGEGMSEAWEQLAATWVQMESLGFKSLVVNTKDINKAEKEVSEASKVVTSDASSGLVAALGLAQDGEVARGAEDGSASRHEALQEVPLRSMSGWPISVAVLEVGGRCKSAHRYPWLTFATHGATTLWIPLASHLGPAGRCTYSC
eukprot:s564_g6.t1